MKRYHSSIFSFDTLHNVKSPSLLAFAISLLVFVGIEGIGRLVGAELTEGWDYWSQTAASKYITYSNLQETQNTPPILVVGDSGADYGFSPVHFNEAIGEPKFSYNLATLGNFPLSFDKTINEIVLSTETEQSQPDYLFIIFTRGGFNQEAEMRQSERSIVHSPVVRRHQGEVTVGHVVSLSRLWRNRMALLAYVKNGTPLISAERGYQSRRDASNEQIVEPEEKQELILDPDRLSVLERTFRASESLGIKPILIHPPVHSFEKLRWENPEAYIQHVQALCEKYQIPLWDYSRNTDYDDYMKDLVHLNAEGAELFSIELAHRFRSMTQ